MAEIAFFHIVPNSYFIIVGHSTVYDRVIDKMSSFNLEIKSFPDIFGFVVSALFTELA
jgi:hypothetical protein